MRLSKKSKKEIRYEKIIYVFGRVVVRNYGSDSRPSD